MKPLLRNSPYAVSGGYEYPLRNFSFKFKAHSKKHFYPQLCNGRRSCHCTGQLHLLFTFQLSFETSLSAKRKLLPEYTRGGYSYDIYMPWVH